MDERFAEWTHFLITGRDNKVLIFGSPSPPIVRKLFKMTKNVFLASDKNIPFEGSGIKRIKLKQNSIFPIANQSIDAAVIIEQKIADYIFIELKRILIPGSKIAIFLREKEHKKVKLAKILSLLKKERQIRRKLRKYNFVDIETYTIIPGIHDPRWILPLDSKKQAAASLQLYQPSLFGAKIKKFLFRVFSYLGFVRALTTNRIVFAKHHQTVSNDLKNIFEEVLGEKNIKLALFTGTPGYHRKVTIQAMGPNGDVLAYGKLAENEQTYKLLKNEVDILNYLASLHLTKAAIPKVLFWGTMSNSKLLIQSTRKKLGSHGIYRLTDLHLNFLGELFTKTTRREIFRKSQCFLKLEKNIGELSKHLDNKWKQRLIRGIKYIGSELGEAEVPLGFCHGDFTPWNTFLDSGKLFVFDWEYATKQSIPLWDIFHFLIHPRILVKKDRAETIVRKVKNHNLLQQYLSFVNINNHEMEVMLLFYLCDISCFYLYKISKQGQSSEEEKKSVNTWGEMLDLILSKLMK